MLDDDDPESDHFEEGEAIVLNEVVSDAAAVRDAVPVDAALIV